MKCLVLATCLSLSSAGGLYGGLVGHPNGAVVPLELLTLPLLPLLTKAMLLVMVMLAAMAMLVLRTLTHNLLPTPMELLSLLMSLLWLLHVPTTLLPAVDVLLLLWLPLLTKGMPLVMVMLLAMAMLVLRT